MSIKYGGVTKYKHAEIFTSLKYNPYRNRILSVGNSMIILLRKLSSPFCGDNLYDNDRSFSHFQLKLPRRNREIIVSICSQDVVMYFSKFVAFSYTLLAVVQWVLDFAVCVYGLRCQTSIFGTLFKNRVQAQTGKNI